MALRHCQSCGVDVRTKHRLPMWFLVILIPLALLTGFAVLFFDMMMAMMVGEEASLLSYIGFIIMASPVVYIILGRKRRCPLCGTPRSSCKKLEPLQMIQLCWMKVVIENGRANLHWRFSPNT